MLVDDSFIIIHKHIKLLIMKTIFIALLCFCSLQLFSQINLVGGFGPTGIVGDQSWNISAGIQVGAEAKVYVFDEQSSVSAGLGLSLQGAAWDENGYSGKTNLTYLNIPLLFTYETMYGIYGEIGLQPGILLSAKDKIDGDSFDYKEYIKSFELGLPVGVGYQLNDELGFGLRVTFGLTNLDDSEYDDSYHNYLVVGIVRYTIDWIYNK